MTPVPNDKWKKKTYADPAPAPGDTGLGEPGRLDQRTNSESGSDDVDRSKELQEDDDNAAQPINRAGDTGTNSAGGASTTKNRGSGSPPGNKKGPKTPVIEEDNPENGKLPAIRIDEKVAWRSAPTRTRIEVRTHAASARLVRLPAYPTSGWLPGDSETEVARRK